MLHYLNGHLPANQTTVYTVHFTKSYKKRGRVEYGAADCTSVLGIKVAEDKCACGSQFPPDSGSLQAHLHNTDAHIHSNVYIHQTLNCYNGIQFIFKYGTHTLRPNLCHVPNPVWHSPNLSLGLSNNGSQGQRD